MKLAALALVTTLGLGGAAYAEPAPPRGEVRQFLLERFDRDRDGKLQPQERRRAVRVLRRLADRLAMQDRAMRQHVRKRRMDHRLDAAGEGTRQPGQASPSTPPPGMMRKLRRFDRNGDGMIGPGEMPPDAARKLRPLDRNRDGWLDDGDGGDQP
jgi:EF hand